MLGDLLFSVVTHQTVLIPPENALPQSQSCFEPIILPLLDTPALIDEVLEAMCLFKKNLELDQRCLSHELGWLFLWHVRIDTTNAARGVQECEACDESERQ